MAHLLRAQPDVVWKRGYVTVGADMATIDQNTFVSVNGDAGGTWTPAADLNIGGAGMICASAWTVIGTSGFGLPAWSTIDTNGSNAQITFGRGTPDDVFGYVTPASYTIVTGFFDHYSVNPEQAAVSLNYSAAVSGVLTQGSTGGRFVVPLRVFSGQGSTITTITLNWTVNWAHVAVPVTLPAMRVYAVDVNGTLFPLRASDGTTTDANGFQPISVATTAAAYNASNANQAFVYTCNQNQVIDVSKYSYFVEIIDESGTGDWTAHPGNTFSSVSAVFTSVLGYDGRN